MTITQYSRIQHRRGLLAELPPVLNTSELGHVVDLQRLFIGNGQLAEGAPITGNTEVITDFTLLSNPAALQWIYRSNTPIVAQTGPTGQEPIVRSVGKKLDDYVNVRDFGALGNGVADDTDAINRALQQIYTVEVPGPFAAAMGYRALYFPAGVYLISGPIFLPPFATIFGDGSTKTIIKQTNPLNFQDVPVVRTADSLFQNVYSINPLTNAPADVIGSNGASFPSNIYARGMTFQNSQDQNIVALDIASNVLFEECGFIGAWTGGSTSSTSIMVNNFGLDHTVYTPTNIKFSHCEFLFTDYIMNLSSTYSIYYSNNLISNVSLPGRFANEVYFDMCDFDVFGWGIYAGTDFQDFKISTSAFSNISNTALYAGVITAPTISQGGFLSSNNTFFDCGSPSADTINFVPGTMHARSLNDLFIYSTGYSQPVRNVSDTGPSAFELSTINSVNINNVNISAKQGPIPLAGNQTNVSTGITIDLTKQNTAIINYTLLINGTVGAGVLTIFSNHANTVNANDTLFDNVYTQSGGGGGSITFNYSIDVNNIMTITYTSTTAQTAYLELQAKSWLS